MNLKKAQKLLQIDFNTLTEDKLQKYKVNIIDAWRYARGDYGYNNDFFTYIPEVNAFVPSDFWLLNNIQSVMDNLFKED